MAIPVIAPVPRLVKQVEFKVFVPDYKDYQTFRFRALPGTHYTAEQIEGMKLAMNNMLTSIFPETHRFHFMRLGPTRFNVLHTVGNA
jgi:hypothetical protein